ncbi:hypothetical protein DL96DRAFT_1817341 [Flagelloscypha sp. PMI_526]|nr:hypothetical protein DL96DRAFT_1817341 [Flagelloscypha sp. PMI_526]
MSTATSNSRAATLKDEGNAFFAKKDYHEAIAKYTDAIDIEPTAVLHANRAQCYLSLEMYMDASADGRKATELDPEYSKGYVRFATAEQKLGNLRTSIDNWEKALKTASQVQKADISIALSKARKAKEAQDDPQSLANKVHIIPDAASQQMPWTSIEGIISDLKDREEWFSSAFVVREAEEASSSEFQRAQSLMSLKRRDGARLGGRCGAIEAYTNCITSDKRMFRILSSDFIKDYSEQVMIESQTRKAWPHEGPSEIKTAVVERLKSQSWDQVRPALSLTIRCWIMKGYVMNSTNTNESAGLEFLQRAIDMLEWGRVTFPSVPHQTKGVIFTDTFYRAVRLLKLDCVMHSFKAPVPTTELEAFYEEVSEILKEVTASIEAKTYGERRLGTAGHILCFYDYHLAEAHALTGLYHAQVANNLRTNGAAQEEYWAHYEKATFSYNRAAKAVPEDDEFHAWYLNASLTNASQCPCPVNYHIETIKRMQVAIPKMEKIWKNSTLAMAGRDDNMKKMMKPLDELERMVRDGECKGNTFMKFD